MGIAVVDCCFTAVELLVSVGSIREKQPWRPARLLVSLLWWLQCVVRVALTSSRSFSQRRGCVSVCAASTPGLNAKSSPQQYSAPLQICNGPHPSTPTGQPTNSWLVRSSMGRQATDHNLSLRPVTACAPSLIADELATTPDL